VRGVGVGRIGEAVEAGKKAEAELKISVFRRAGKAPFACANLSPYTADNG
jgi:hypothetical protein